MKKNTVLWIVQGVLAAMFLLAGGSKLVMFDGGHMFFLTRERTEFLDRVAAFVADR